MRGRSVADKAWRQGVETKCKREAPTLNPLLNSLKRHAYSTRLLHIRVHSRAFAANCTFAFVLFVTFVVPFAFDKVTDKARDKVGESPEGARYTSPGQRPWEYAKMTTSPEGAGYSLGTRRLSDGSSRCRLSSPVALVDHTTQSYDRRV